MIARSRIARGVVLWVAVAVIVLFGAAPRTLPPLESIARPSAADAAWIALRIGDQDSLMPFAPAPADIGTLIYRFPEGTLSPGRLSLRPNSKASLPRLGRIGIPQLLQDRTGLFLAVGVNFGPDPDDRRFAYLKEISDPRYARLEGLVGGELHTTVVRTSGGVFSARYPIVESQVVLFDLIDGAVNEVYFILEQNGLSLPVIGRRIEVRP